MAKCQIRLISGRCTMYWAKNKNKLVQYIMGLASGCTFASMAKNQRNFLFTRAQDYTSEPLHFWKNSNKRFFSLLNRPTVHGVTLSAAAPATHTPKPGQEMLCVNLWKVEEKLKWRCLHYVNLRLLLLLQACNTIYSPRYFSSSVSLVFDIESD